MTQLEIQKRKLRLYIINSVSNKYLVDYWDYDDSINVQQQAIIRGLESHINELLFKIKIIEEA